MAALVGTEKWTVELRGALSSVAARALLPAPLEPGAGAEAAVGLLLLEMRDLTLRGVPGPGLSYREALWRVAASHRGRPVWFTPAVDVDQPLVRVLAAQLIRYPTRAARLARDGDQLALAVAGARLEVRLGREGSEPPADVAWPLLTWHGRQLYEVPWTETPPRTRTGRRVTVDDGGVAARTLGAAVRWSPDARVLEGRGHQCGFARRCS